MRWLLSCPLRGDASNQDCGVVGGRPERNEDSRGDQDLGGIEVLAFGYTGGFAAEVATATPRGVRVGTLSHRVTSVSADKETPSTPAVKAEAEGDSGKNKVMPFSPSARNAGMMLPDLTRRVRVEREMPSSAALSLAVMRPALCMHRALHRSMGLRKHILHETTKAPRPTLVRLNGALTELSYSHASQMVNSAGSSGM